MFNHRHYVPILKWKQGEYQALLRLSNQAKDGIIPLIEIPPIGYDYAEQKNVRDMDEHLQGFGRRLKEKWQSRRCFVDLSLLGGDTTMKSKQHCVGYLLGKARENQCNAVPVVRLNSTKSYVEAVAAAVALDKRGICLRLVATDFDREDLKSDIDTRLGEVRATRDSADLVIDLGASGYPSDALYVQTATAILGMLPYVNQWRTLTLAGTSYPELVSQAVKPPYELVPRREWVTYKALAKKLGEHGRIPTFGDYAAAHPDVIEMDMRIVKPLAKLRYTTGDAWHIGLGNNVRTNGFSQYKTMCSTLTGKNYYDGPNFSAGDSYIYDCANGLELTGNLTTWVWVATSRHLTKVAFDLANLPAT